MSAAPYGEQPFQETEFSTPSSSPTSENKLTSSNYHPSIENRVSKSYYSQNGTVLELFNEQLDNGIINGKPIKVSFEEEKSPGSDTSPTKEMDESNAYVNPSGGTSKRAYVAVAILFFINLLNYMDRYTVAGVLTSVQDDFQIDNAKAGLLQTIFICAYMIFAPIFGYLGDRYSRKWIMIVGIFIWSATVMASTFVPKNLFYVFLVCRGVVGIGEASYSTVASTLIADLFTKNMRTRMLMVFYFAIPVGSGLGFMVGSSVASLFPDEDIGWRWGVRVTPFFGVICLLLLIFVLKEPQRGQSEHVSHLQETSYLGDLKYLLKNRSFVWTTLGFTCVTFASGSLSWWCPAFVQLALESEMKPFNSASIGLIFGVITCLAGFFGVSIGSTWAQFWRRTNSKADPLVCGIGILLSIPFMYIGLTFIRKSLPLGYTAVFFAVLCLSLNWAIVSDILMYIVTPNRRSTASAFQILFSHLLGDATSPYLIGVVSDSIQGSDGSSAAHFFALQYAMYIPCFILVIGGFFFLGTAWYVETDRRNTELVSTGHDPAANVSTIGGSPSSGMDRSPTNGYGGIDDHDHASILAGEFPSPESTARLISPDDDGTTAPRETDVRYRL